MGLPNSRRRHLQAVFCSMELNVRSKQKPISAGISKGHPNAAGVDDAKFANHAVELHMRMAANKQSASVSPIIETSLSSGVSRVKTSLGFCGVA